MGLYGFKERFAPFILSGKKTHTIRGIRAHPDKPGNIIHCYTGLRTKNAKLIGRFECVLIEEIEITGGVVGANRRKLTGKIHLPASISINEQRLDVSECEALARRDGFSNFHEMIAFWDGRLPFVGHIIHWKYEKPMVHGVPRTRSFAD